jgi:hypothetical protein
LRHYLDQHPHPRDIFGKAPSIVKWYVREFAGYVHCESLPLYPSPSIWNGRWVVKTPGISYLVTDSNLVAVSGSRGYCGKVGLDKHLSLLAKDEANTEKDPARGAVRVCVPASILALAAISLQALSSPA